MFAPRYLGLEPVQVGAYKPVSHHSSLFDLLWTRNLFTDCRRSQCRVLSNDGKWTPASIPVSLSDGYGTLLGAYFCGGAVLRSLNSLLTYLTMVFFVVFTSSIRSDKDWLCWLCFILPVAGTMLRPRSFQLHPSTCTALHRQRLQSKHDGA